MQNIDNQQMQTTARHRFDYFFACKINEFSAEVGPGNAGFFRIAAVINPSSPQNCGRIFLCFPNSRGITLDKGSYGYMLSFNMDFLNFHTNSGHLLEFLMKKLGITEMDASAESFQVEMDNSITIDIINIIKACAIGQRLNNPSNFYSIAASSVYTIILMMFKEKNDKNYSFSSMGQLQTCLDYIEKNYMHDLTAKKLSQLALMSETAFRKLFSDKMGMPLKKYISKVRISRAVSLLDDNYASLKDIASMVGYRDMSTFYRNFCKEMNMAPSQYTQKRKYLPPCSLNPW